ncbi:MAG TPA: Rne/Rng family ribonuclease [Actinomycetota bacterium]|nr:Rne/Rng family ribonuclease [Actinomycetota bacterium]
MSESSPRPREKAEDVLSEAPVPSAAAATPGGEKKQSGPRRRRRRGPRRRSAAKRTATNRVMLVHGDPNGTQIAVLEDGSIVEHYVARAHDRSLVGNVYLGRVQNVLPGMEASFVEIGEARNGVLYAGEVGLAGDEGEGEVPRIETVLKSGQPILVQVTKDPMSSKGARLTALISIAGRHLVLVPNARSLGVSRRLADAERARLRDLSQALRPKEHGLIVRTAAEGVSQEDLERDLSRLLEIWAEIEKKAGSSKAPALVYSEPELELRVIRDLFNRDVSRCVVDDRDLESTLRDYVRATAPDLGDRLELYEGDLPIFEEFRVLEQIRKSLDRRVWLPSGGHLVIDRTEAMTVVDVNTGKFVGKSNLEETVFRTNKEAAVEVARQLRLRDIGGIIVIDFIDMEISENRDEVLRVFRAELDRDKTRTHVFDISPLGLVQMTRKNVSAGIVEAFSDPCPTCEGRGILIHDVD